MANQVSLVRSLLVRSIHANDPRGSISRALSALALRNGKVMREGRHLELDAINALSNIARGLTCGSKVGLPGCYSLVRNYARNALDNLNQI